VADAPDGGRGGWVLLATGLGLFMIFLDATIVNVAIPDIQNQFHTGESGIQWVVAAYSLTMAMFMMTAATFGDLRGRRVAYVVGLVIFCVASGACGLSPSLGFLAGARAVQGVGAAVVNVASLALVGAAYRDPREKMKAIGIWTGIAAVGLAIGPTVGGYLTESFGWRSIFAFNPIIGAIAIALTFRFIGESRDPSQRSYDVPGQVLFIVGIGALTLALIQAPQRGWLSGLIIGSFVLAAVTLASFALRELRTDDPMMDVRLFRDAVYTSALYTLFALLFCAYGTLFVVTQYFQNVRGYSPEEAGVLMLAFTLPSLVLAPLAGRIVAARGGRGPGLVGLGCAAIGTAIFAASNASHLSVTEIGLLFLGTGVGLGATAATSVAMVGVPHDRSGMASGILSSQRALGSTAGFAIMGSVLAVTVSISLPHRLEPLIPDQATRDQVVQQVVEDANPQAVTSLMGPGEPLPDSVSEDQAVLAQADDAFIAGIRVAMLVGFAITVSAFVLGWFTFPRRRSAGTAPRRAGSAVGVRGRDRSGGPATPPPGVS
jgi:EmrB/QacA subfamily drug resistance transporter